VRDDRDVESRVNLSQPLVPRHTPIAREAPAKPTLPRMARDQAADTRGDDEGFQDNRAGVVADGLVEELQDGHVGGCCGDAVQIAEAEHHADAEEPCGDEADADGAHDGDWDHFLRVGDLLCEVRCAIQAGEGPVAVDQADDEGDAILRPAGGVDESCEDKFGGFVGGSFGGDGDEDDGEGDEGDVEGTGGEGGKDAAVAIEEEGEKVD
jgi:hypothetical protein